MPELEVSVIGKALTPVPQMPQLDLESKQRHNGPLSLSLRRYHSDIKVPLRLFLEPSSRKQNTGLKSPYNDRSHFDLGITFRNMTLAETYNFARTQLTSNPIPNIRQIKTPVLTYSRRTSLPVFEKEASENTSKDVVESSRSATPHISSGSETNNDRHEKKNFPVKSNEVKNSMNRRYSRSVCGFRKQKKSTYKRKTGNGSNIINSNKTDRLPPTSTMPKRSADFSSRNILLPPKTKQSSFNTLRNAYDTNEREHRLFEHERSKKKHGSKSNSENISIDKCKNPIPERFARKNNGWSLKGNDALLASLDSASSRNSSLNKRQLSMRIQLIHRYGDEDVLSKHMELKRKQETADKHERKNLEMKANERLKEQQRAKIYALNALMTELEQEQFQQYKQSL